MKRNKKHCPSFVKESQLPEMSDPGLGEPCWIEKQHSNQGTLKF